MIENIKISIICPVYNTEQYLCQCIDSVLVQSYTNFELILINDGSKDNSLNICNNYELKDKRVKVIHQENQGVSIARNKGIDVASGDYLAFIDSDDWWDINFLFFMVCELKKNDFSICKLIRVKDCKETPDLKYDVDMNIWCWPIINTIPVSMCRGLFNLKIINEYNIRFTNEIKIGEDQEFTYKYLLLLDKISYCENAKYYYRLYSNSSMIRTNPYEYFKSIYGMNSVIKFAYKYIDNTKFSVINNAISYFKFPYIIEFAVLSIMSKGESLKKIKNYLIKNNYYDILNNACNSDKHRKSVFMKLWKVSPNLCLNYFYIKKIIGRIIRKMLRNK